MLEKRAGLKYTFRVNNREIEARSLPEVSAESRPTALDYFNEAVAALRLRRTRPRDEFFDKVADRVIAPGAAMRVFQSPIEEVRIAGDAFRETCKVEPELKPDLVETFTLAATQVRARMFGEK